MCICQEAPEFANYWLIIKHAIYFKCACGESFPWKKKQIVYYSNTKPFLWFFSIPKYNPAAQSDSFVLSCLSRIDQIKD